MPSVELSKLQGIGPARALSESDRTPLGSRLPASGSGGAKPGIMVDVGPGAIADTARPPIDQERVAEIRDAVRNGSYPLVPAQIADAMIAAQVSFAIISKDQE